MGHNHKSIRYIEKVALAWAEEGITSVEEAKQSGLRYNKDLFFYSQGSRNHQPQSRRDRDHTDGHLASNLWLFHGGHPGSCNRTVLQTGQASFQYTDKILEGWKKKDVHTIDDIHTLDTEHKKRRQDRKAASSKPAQPSNNRFNNFQQREYNFDEYEKHLLNQ